MRWFTRLSAKMAASYVLVTVAAVALVEAVVLGIVVPPLLATADVTSRLGNTAGELAKTATLVSQKLGRLPTRTELPLGDDRVPATSGTTTTHGDAFALPYVSDDAPLSAQLPFAVLTKPNGTIVNTSWPRRYPVGTQIATIAEATVTRQSAGSGNGFRWAVTEVGRFGFVYVQVPATKTGAAGTTELTPALKAAPWILAVVLPVGVLFGLLSTRRLVRRLRRLADGTLRVADGDLSLRLPVTGRDEVSQVETNFNRMTERLRDAIHGERQSASAAARLAERARIARELHDSISQDLFSLRMLAGGLERALPPDSPLREQVLAIESTASGATREMRALLLELRPVALEDAGLVPALTELASAYHQRLGVEVRLTLGDVTLRPAAEHTVLRVAQEAMSNAVRHGNAGTVELTLVREGDGVRFVIRDDGTGFDVSDAPVGLGLGMMRERAAEVGGSVDVATAPGAGTTVRLWLP